MAPNRLVKHFAAVSCSVVASCASAGSTVYWWCNLSIPANIDGYYINVETQTYGSVGSVVAGWDINPYGSTNLTCYNAAGTGMMRYPGVTSGSAGNLGQQMAVGGSGVTNDGLPTSFGSGAVTVGVQPGNWRLNSVNYFGFRFIAADGLVHYGHGCCHVGPVITDRTIAYLAYESTPGAPSCVALVCLPCPTDLTATTRRMART